MLGGNLGKRSRKGSLSGEPFIDDHPKSVLIGGGTRMRLDLLRSHIRDGTDRILGRLIARTLCDDGDAKVTEHHLTVFSHQHVFWLHVAMDQLVFMRIM